MGNPLQIFIMFLKLTPLNGFAVKLEKDLEDGTITVAEGFDLAATISAEAQAFLPNQKAELELARKIAVAVQEYLAAKPPAAAQG